MKNSMRSVFGLSLTLGTFAFANASETCTYSDWSWDTQAGQVVDFKTVHTTKDRLSEEQRHPELPCTICREDMIEIQIEELEPFSVCHIVAPAIEEALHRALDDGFPITTVTAYRVGRTKGPVDDQARRTQYSHHSFGLAIDINAHANGLYGNCFEFGPDCTLRRGGIWHPDNPEAITRGSPIYMSMQNIGFLWGGELYGRQKDFMHFSLSGD